MYTDIIEKCTRFSKQFELQDEEVSIKTLNKAVDFLFEEARETVVAVALYGNSEGKDKSEWLEEVVDGFGDVAFVALNGIYKTFISLGFNHLDATEKTRVVMNRICNANLAKLTTDGTVLRDAKGKVKKPDGWQPPTYDDLL